MENFHFLHPVDMCSGHDPRLLFVADYGTTDGGGQIVCVDTRQCDTYQRLKGCVRPTALCCDPHAQRLLVCDAGDVACGHATITGCNILEVSLMNGIDGVLGDFGCSTFLFERLGVILDWPQTEMTSYNYLFCFHHNRCNKKSDTQSHNTI